MGKFNEWLNKKITPIPALYKNPYTGVLKDLISKQNKGETVAKKYVETQLDEDYLGRIKKDIYEYPAYAEALEVPMLQDLKNIYLKTPQTFNSFSISKYRPKNGTQTNYFNSKILDTIGAGIVVKAGDNLKNKNVVPTDKLENMNYGEISHITPNNNAVAVLPGIGHATVGIGHDQKGEYVSYYDNWDVGNFKPNTKHLIDFFNKGVPVYGRVYLDDYYDIPEEARGNPFITPSVITAYKKGGRIHIKKKNRGKFTEYCGGKVTEECIAKGKNSKDPKIRKRATFAANARKWKHENGGILKAQEGTTVSSERIPILEEYIQMKQQEARQKALANSYNATEPRLAKKYYTEEELNRLRFEWKDAEGGFNMFNEYAEETEKKLNHPLAPEHLFIFNPIYRNVYTDTGLNDSGEKLLDELSSERYTATSYKKDAKEYQDKLDHINEHGYDWTGFGCLTNATGWYGDSYICASNIDFKKDPSKYGFIEINADDALPGDIFQYDTETTPSHATMYSKKGDDGTYYSNYSNGKYEDPIRHDIAYWGKGKRAFRFVGLPKDIEAWTQEYNESYGKKFGGVLDKFKNGGILKAQKGTGNNFWSKLWNAVKEGGMAARDAKLGAVGAQQVRDLYSEGENQEARDLAKQYAKANTTGIALAGGAASTGLLGDLMVTGATTAADTFIDGDTENFGKNLVKNAAADLIGHGAFGALKKIRFDDVLAKIKHPTWQKYYHGSPYPFDINNPYMGTGNDAGIHASKNYSVAKHFTEGSKDGVIYEFWAPKPSREFIDLHSNGLEMFTPFNFHKTDFNAKRSFHDGTKDSKMLFNVLNDEGGPDTVKMIDPKDNWFSNPPEYYKPFDITKDLTIDMGKIHWPDMPTSVQTRIAELNQHYPRYSKTKISISPEEWQKRAEINTEVSKLLAENGIPVVKYANTGYREGGGMSYMIFDPTKMRVVNLESPDILRPTTTAIGTGLGVGYGVSQLKDEEKQKSPPIN